MFLQDDSFRLVGGEMELVIGQEMLSLAVSLDSPDDLRASPHIVISDGQRKWTSVSMFLRKQ